MNYQKWNIAMRAMFLLSFPGVWWDPKDYDLVTGEIGPSQLADPSEHARIRDVERNVKILRATYERRWNADKLSDDQRCIYAICSIGALEPHAGVHDQWTKAFVEGCSENGLDDHDGGNYQKRFELYTLLQPVENEAPRFSFYYGKEVLGGVKKPADFVSPDLGIKEHCHGPGCFESSGLRHCTGCKVVKYCSQECQHRGWQNHKHDCQTMAGRRKDKAAIAGVAKRRNFHGRPNW